MTTLREAAQQALEALEEFGTHYEYCPRYPTWARPELQPPCNCGLDSNVVALRTALAQQDEPKGGGNLPPPLAGRAGAAAQREKVAHWMRSMGYATGHGDTIEDLLDHLGTQISEGLEVEVLMEREACAKECDAVSASADKAAVDGQYLIIRNGAEARRCAAAIRARSKT